MEKDFSKLKAESEHIFLPDECEDNDRAVSYLAQETGAGYYDDLNLLIMAALIIFISVTFLAVNGGKLNNDEEFSLSMRAFLSGELTSELEERYIESLPIPEEIKAAEDRVSLLYGFGNTVSERKNGNYSQSNTGDRTSYENNASEPEDDNRFSENAVTTKAAQTDADGNTVTEEESVVTAPGGGTTAVSRPPLTRTSTAKKADAEKSTTTNNDAPKVTATTTVMAEPSGNTATAGTELPPDETEPTETEPADTEPTETEPDLTGTEPSETETEPPEEPPSEDLNDDEV